jgi:hypothetical protein
MLSVVRLNVVAPQEGAKNASWKSSNAQTIFLFKITSMAATMSLVVQHKRKSTITHSLPIYQSVLFSFSLTPSVSLSFSLCLHFSLSLSLSLCVCVCTFLSFSLCPYFLSLSIYVAVLLPPSQHQSFFCLYHYLPLYIFLFVSLCVCLSV